MSLILYIAIVLIILSLCLWADYEYTARQIALKIPALIHAAKHMSSSSGREKMQYVVMQLVEEVPLIFRKSFTPEKLEALAQAMYDSMKAYGEEMIRAFSA